MRTVQLYINDKRVDLFQDEEVVVTSSVQNIKDIAKVFTDFTQTFTVPCSPNNNQIFDHFYQNDVDGTFKAKTRASARIEINGTPFRKGKVQLEGSTIKENQAEAYKITFYGDVVTLKDLFGEDKLQDLDYTGLNEEYTGANVQTSITSTSDLDVRYPLISSSRVWSYGDAAATDVSVSGNAIEYTELFPALKDSKIFDLIESKYGVTFSGNFLTNKRFTNSFLWWKNRETADFRSEYLDMDFNPLGLSCNANLPANAVGINEVNVQYIDIQNYTQPAGWASWGSGHTHYIRIQIFNTSNSNNWNIDVYKNGAYIATYSDSGDTIKIVLTQSNINGLNDTYTFKFSAYGSMTFDFKVSYVFRYYYTNGSGTQLYAIDDCNFTTTSNSVTQYLDFSSAAPDMTIAEYFSGTLKQFNLTCYPLDDDLTYQIEPLEDYYRFGDEQNITEYVDVNEILVDRPKLYNDISFSYAESKSFMNEAYLETNNKAYASLKEVFPDYDGGKYEVKLPFENLLFNKFTNENLQVGYCLTKAPDYKPYIPKPVKLYLYENQTADVDFYFDNGSTVPQITNYVPFGAEVQHNNEDYSNSFGEEYSTLTLNPQPNSLYKTYYQPYLVNLFNDKTRLVTVKCVLPLSMLTSLTLDDAVIIRDKKYRINDMSSNLVTGEVKLVLISDWVKSKRKIVFPLTDQTGGTIVVPVKPPKGGYINISAPVETKFITSSPTLPASNLTTEQNQTITIPSNGTGADRTQTITYTAYYPDGSTAWTETVVLFQEGSSYYLLVEAGGYLFQENLFKIAL